MSYFDRILVCRDCSNTFTFSAGEQSFYAARGLVNDPQRCPTCRSAARRGTPGAAAASTYVSYGPSASSAGANPGRCTRPPAVPAAR